ncbi:MAG: hypothetical protein D6776_01920 [Planctomycetota bacterium]|nr:MAG: hypothetical protein D6776_01920 [Planctomycetota bacterium]
MALRERCERADLEILLISADDPATNRRFRERLAIPYPLLSDRTHEVADRYGVPISRRHWQARNYPDGFIQPALFAFDGERPLYRWITRPRLLNLFGAARRPEPAAVLEAIERALEADDR